MPAGLGCGWGNEELQANYNAWFAFLCPLGWAVDGDSYWKWWQGK